MTRRLKAVSFASAGAALALAVGACSPTANQPEAGQSPPEESQSEEGQSQETQSQEAEAEAEAEQPADTEELVEEAADQDAGTTAGSAAESGGGGWTLGPVEHRGEYADVEGAQPIVTDVRVGAHDGYDRVVAEFTGDEALGWRAQWVNRPHEVGRGDPINIPGSAFLDVNVTGVGIPMTDEDYELYFDQRGPLTAGSVAAVYDATFEGSAHIVIGVDQQRPFKIYQLDNPLRVVIDIQTP